MVTELWSRLKRNDKPIVLYGMGNGGDKAIDVLNSFDIPLSGVFASDGFVRNKTFHGFKISSYSELKEKFGEMTVLLCFGSALPDVLENIKKIEAEQEFYAPDLPVYGNTLFTAKFYNNNKSDFDFIYEKLADGLSKHTFESIINYKISGKLKYLYDCETDPAEPIRSFLNLNENENYFDLGAYNGDTVKEYLKTYGGAKSITAVEPDTKNFKKLTANTKDIDNIRLVNACITDSVGFSSFAMNGGRNSAVGDGKTIPSVSVDSLSGDITPTFIKADIEGAELKMIEGMGETLKNHKPKMRISCYHRSEDLTVLPNAVFKKRENYALYLRHFPCVPAWDTDYYFV